jgi:hypothetical protein
VTNPGPMGPLSDNPHVGVLMIYACIATAVAMSLALGLPGLTKLVAIVPGAVAAWFWVASVRVQIRDDRDTP